MPSSGWVLAVSLVYLAACLIVGMTPGRRKSQTTTDGYVAGDRTLGLLVMYFITGATIFSAFAFLGGPGWAYSRGAAVFYILGYGAVGFVPFYFLGPRAARVGRRYGFVTQAEMVSHRFRSPILAGLMALISTVAFIPYLAIQMKGAGYVLSAVTNGALSPSFGAAMVYGVVLIYVLRSGVLGVGWTNTFQGIFMMVLAWGLGLYLPWKLYGGVSELFTRVAAERPELLDAPGLASSGEPWGWGAYSTAVLVSIVGFTAWPHIFMKAFSAADEKTIKRTVVLYPTFQLFLVPLFIIGFCGVFFESAPEKADQILPHMLMNMEVPSLIVGLFCAGALAASMSSGDAMVHASASILVRDGLVTAGGLKWDSQTQTRVIRITLVGVMIAAYVVAVFYQGSLVGLLLSAYGAIVQFMPLLVATLYLRRVPTLAAVGGLFVGAATTVAVLMIPGLNVFGWHSGFYGLIANVLTMVLLTLKAKEVDEVADEFVSVAEGR